MIGSKNEEDTCVANGQLLSWLNQPTCQHLENKKLTTNGNEFEAKIKNKLLIVHDEVGNKTRGRQVSESSILGLSLSPYHLLPTCIPFPP